MFALLEHETESTGTASVHWDFLVEALVYERLPTWRLAADPRATPGPIPAERIGDHRRLYLDYEGEVSGGRGRVRRLDRGPARIQRFEGDELIVELGGAALAGRFRIGRDGPGALVFERIAATPAE